ncbi:MAG TPA: hypothetical protein VHM30_03135, partial [Gemmatimonadaceae bacterium]|nr:hypothetical protein [Gemmatimonadaceae bacterium]
ITRLPLTLEYGVLRRLTLGVSAPLVRRRVEISADTGIRAAGAPPSVTRVTDLSAFANLNHSNVGDIDFSARIGILDGFASSAPLRARLAVEGIFRLAAGPSRNASVLTDPGAGDGQNDIEGRVLADLALGRRWSISARATRTVQRPDRQLIVSADSVFPSRRIAMGVERDLGDITAIDVIPRVTITRFLSLAGVVSQRSKGADTYDGAVPAPAWGLVAEPTGSSSTTRVGIGVVFATGPGAIGRAPLELSFQHSQLVRTSGSTVPDFRADQIGGRVYIKLF